MEPILIDNFAVQRADGAELAVRFHEMAAVDGSMLPAERTAWR
jgi:hypothetical protein